MKITKTGEAGREEKGDIYVKIEPASEGTGLKIDLTSSVERLYGERIRQTILDVLEEFGVEDAHVTAIDHGALDFVIRARVEAVLTYYSREEVSI
ncbi:MAG: citrate lyase acyl carrier protein [candidate division Zixibacteria bacterium 4484_93]|nr:MAG: citrate lyase acyl carrier protein [candidate division Zixibacteria bacterium 4484_93]RKZ33135.1 MAG: citrate lyase acyl carrier protein [bacterium]